jgi:hypothetical protein
LPGSRDRGAGPERLSVRTWDVMGTARARTGGWAAPPGHWWGEGGGGGWGKRARARRETLVRIPALPGPSVATMK